MLNRKTDKIKSNYILNLLEIGDLKDAGSWRSFEFTKYTVI